MELLLLLLPLALVGVFIAGGDSDDDGSDPVDDPSADPVIRAGTAGADILTGGPGDDLILGGAGPDVVTGRAGDDILLGENDDDSLVGGAGSDILLGGGGADTLLGGAGRDLLLGGAGRDLLYGGAGDDLLIGGSDADTLQGGDGNDILVGLETLPSGLADANLDDLDAELLALVQERYGSAVSDRFGPRLTGAVFSADADTPPRPDFLTGGNGDDLLIGDFGDVMVGGDGTDQFVVVHTPGAAPVEIRDLTPGEDIVVDLGTAPGTISVASDGTDGFVLLDDAIVAIARGVTDTATLEAALVVDRAPPPADDRIQFGDSTAQALTGGPRDDLILGAGGADTLSGGPENDILLGEGGSDLIEGGPGRDILLGGAANDTLVGGAGEDWLVGGAGDDVVYGGEGDDLIWGSSGENALYGGNGNDIISSLDPRGNLTPAYNLAGLNEPIDEFLAERYGADIADSLRLRVLDSVLSNTPGNTEFDVVYGGDGNDEFFADLGDEIVGGAGVDVYIVLHAPGELPVVVRDYEPGEPIRLITNAPDTGAIVVTEDGGGNLRISFGGSDFLTLTNTTLATLNPADITVRFDDVPFARAS